MKVPSYDFDDVDRKILAHLQSHGRATMKDLGALVGLSGPAAAERVRRLEERGVIRGYRADVPPERVGRSVIAFIHVAIPHGRHGELERYLSELDDVVECHRITGEDCYLLRVAVPDVGRLQQLIDQIGAIGRTRTSLVLSTPIRPKPVLPPDEATTTLTTL